MSSSATCFPDGKVTCLGKRGTKLSSLLNLGELNQCYVSFGDVAGEKKQMMSKKERLIFYPSKKFLDQFNF